MEQVEREKLTENILKMQRRMFNMLHADEDPEWVGSDLTMPQLKILGLLYYHGPLRMSRIAELLVKTVSTATGIADRLVEEKFVRREEDPKDRRAVVISLTEKGQEICESFMTQGWQRTRNLLSRMSEAELQVVLQSIELFVRALQEENEEKAVRSAERN
jgi:DNA-binding MarR family transcriptional regulator